MLSLCQMLIFISWEGYQHFPMHWVIITTTITKKVCYRNASNIKAVRTSNFYTKTDYFSFFFLLKKLLQRLDAIRPTRSLSRDSLLKDHLKQKQYSKTASRSRPSSAKSTTSSVSHFSRSPSESSLMIGDSLSVASSRISSGSRQSAQGRKISRPVWESGW